MMAHDLRIGCVWLHGCYVQAVKRLSHGTENASRILYFFTAVSHQLLDLGVNVFALKPPPA